jgi:uncharacterized protein YcbX
MEGWCEVANPKIVALYRYPVKGFSPEPLERCEIEAGGTIPFDRAFAVENGPSGFDPAAPAHFTKRRFLMLMTDERIAELSTRFDDASGVFSIERDGALQTDGSLYTADGRRTLEAWMADYFRAELRGRPRILSAPGHSFSDMKTKVLHLVNLASVRELEEKLGREVNPLRFRPNIVIDDAPAWSEFAWLDSELQLPGIRLRGLERTTRCAATNVDPENGHRDMEIPRALDALYGHMDFGIYLTATTKGDIALGDQFKAESTPAP